MKTARIIFILIPLLVLITSADAFDWKSLHEKSEKITLQEAQEYASRSPESIEQTYLMGLKYLDHYRYQQAQETFRKVLEKEPDQFEAQWGLAEALLGLHNFAESVPLLQKVIAQHPGFAPAYNSLAYIYYIRTEFADSARLTRGVMSLDASSIDLTSLVEAHCLYAAAKGMLAEHGGPLTKTINFFAVKKHLKIAKELDPDSIFVNFGYGSFFLSIPSVLGRDLEKAEEYLKKAVEADPLFADSYVRLAQIAKARGAEDRYREYLAKALELDPKNELAWDMQNGTCLFVCPDQPERNQ